MKRTVKKTLSLIMAVMLIFSCAALGASAAVEDAKIIFTTDDKDYSYGDTVEIIIKAENESENKKTYIFDIYPQKNYIFDYDSRTYIEYVEPGDTGALVYEMQVHQPEKAGIFELIKRIINNIKFIFTKFDYKIDITVEGAKKTIGIDVTEYVEPTMPEPPEINIDKPEIAMSAAEIAAAYNSAVNTFKAFEGKSTVNKTETISIGVADVPMVVASVLNQLCESFSGATVREYVFQNGEDPDGRTPAYVISPYGRNAAVVAEDLASAKAYEGENGGKIYRLDFVSEKAFFNGTETTTEAVHHNNAFDCLNLAALDFGTAITISEADMTYPGAIIVAEVDSDGKLTRLYHYLPIEAQVEGEAIITLAATVFGDMTTEWKIIY